MAPEGSDNDDRYDSSHRADQHEFVNKLLHHDLTNHLLIIQGNVDLLSDELEDANALDRLQTIYRQTEAAFSLLEETKSEVNGLRGESLEVVDVGSAIEAEIGHIEAAYPEATISVESLGDITVQAPAFLGSIFSNLVRNAIEYNDANSPRVRVTISVEGDTLELVVEDNGPGIPEGVLNNLTNTADRDDGGMGLHIVHSLVKEHDGTIAFDSDSDGTTISVKLPVGNGIRRSSTTSQFAESKTQTSIHQPIRDDESPWMTILRAVGVASNRRIEDLEPLAQTVDPDAVEALLRGGSGTCIEFVYEGYRITVTRDDITIQSITTG